MRTGVILLLPVLAACAGAPPTPPGTRRADVLLAFGEPALSFAHDTVLVYAATYGVAAGAPPEAIYTDGGGRILNEELRVRPGGVSARVFVFDDDGVLLRRL
jgi:hypothetical protein